MGGESIRLTVVGPSGAVVSCRVAGARIRIGRDAENEVHLVDAEASRLHAELVRAEGAWTLSDKGSRNGTRLNGRTIPGPRRVARGDEIGIGNSKVLVDVDPDEAAATRSTRVLTPSEVVATTALVGGSAALKAAVDMARRVAAADVGVLLLGENGTGKEVLAHLLHTAGRRAGGPFVVVNCPALPGALLESELFGVERGVATGVEERSGLFETAKGGTLLLDEIGDMEPSAQAKILRVLETKTTARLGGRAPQPIDVRIVAATNHDLAADVEKGMFRRDLYHRLNAVAIRLPPLRARLDDLPALVEHFVARSSRPDATFSPEAMEALARHSFPGNVRELKHIVERACLLADGPLIGVPDLPDELRGAAPAAQVGDDGDDGADRLLARIVDGGEPFWDVVAEPYLKRRLSRDAVVRFVAAARTRAGGSYKAMAAMLRLSGEYKRLLNFLNHHDLGD